MMTMKGITRLLLETILGSDTKSKNCWDAAHLAMFFDVMIINEI